MSEPGSVLRVVLPVLALLCGSCREQASSGPPAPAPPRIPPESRQIQPLEDRLLQMGGEIDVGNRYLATVMLTTSAGEGKRRCSGVLLSPRRVLTAGHCVCMPRQAAASEGAEKTLIDTSACAEATTLRTVTYQPPQPGVEDVASRVEVFRGSVHPHPELKIVFDARGHLVSSHADLALIHLAEPVERGFRFPSLADAEVQVGEFITVVGHGYDEFTEGHDGERRASQNKVTQASTLREDRVRLEQPRQHRYQGDSGGPCLRESAGGPELVGISSRSLGEGASFTSLQPYRNWLRTQLQEIGRRQRDEPSPSRE